MQLIRSFISHLGAATAAAGLALLAGCGGGDGAGAVPAPQYHASSVAAPRAAAQAAATIRVHYHRAQGDAARWGVYAWEGPQVPSSTWISDRFMFAGADAFGGYVDIPVNLDRSAMSFVVTDGAGNKNCGGDQSAAFAANIASAGQQIWLLEGDCKVYDAAPAVSVGKLGNASAHWLNAATIAWPGVPASGKYTLFYAADGGLGADGNGVTGASASIDLAVAGALPPALKAQYPHLAGATALALSAPDAAAIAAKISGQFALAQYDAAGKLLQLTSLQSAGMLDSLYAAAAADSKLGVTIGAGGAPTFRVWAPTAKSVALDLYPDADGASSVHVAMTRAAASGVWQYTARDAGWVNRYYYTYTVKVLSRWADNALVSNVVTDPYSLSLSANGRRSFVADLDSEALKPHGWDRQSIPPLAHPSDIALYELHVRDFSASDATVPGAHRGKFLAFTDAGSNGMRHLSGLQRAGLTHIHLLPSFDIASVAESGCGTPKVPRAAPDSSAQQAAVAAGAQGDCFNWGYDPVHYTAPDGAFASDANDGAVRVREFRQMVQALHGQGLRVAMDVVYNHTSDARQGPLSVLDKIVPTYYYRLNASGAITTDSCCSDTAAENAMMAKLMIDSVATWARQYKVDSFRFDLMGFAPLALMTRLRDTVNRAAGRELYYYGEAWNFGSVANDARFVIARQANMFGSGIGSFNDRLRDAVRGGGCCDGGNALISQQGFINGAYYDPNALSTQTLDDLLRLGDLVKVGLSGTLRDYQFTDRNGVLRKNSQIDYAGQQAGFTADPAESVNYVEAHDNQTLFDLNAFKLPVSTSPVDRVRVHNLGTAITVLSQGIPFIHAGQELLRSKSLDRDSYNAGDWFNLLDYSYQSNNFGVGLPMAERNQENWPLMAPILRNPLIKPDSTAIRGARDYFTEMLAIRNDSSLFRLRTAQDVSERLRFHNVGPQQVPGVIAMTVDGQHPRPYPGARYKSVALLINVDKVAKSLTVAELRGRSFKLQTLHRANGDVRAREARFDAATGAFSIPARTAVVFVEPAARAMAD
ncbi:pullulanase [Janthinobacterium sp. CG_23.3]|uniref:alpha-1,6-glucosidase domain-containing protein n=1 Tax=Janthinobacterium sp. CG_23.3 TaxID=3349634 RepID=UPI0038D4149F